MDKKFEHSRDRYGIVIIHSKEYAFTILCLHYFGNSEAFNVTEVQGWDQTTFYMLTQLNPHNNDA